MEVPMDRHPLRPSPDPRRSTSPAAAPRIVFLALAVATLTGPVARPYAAGAAARAADAPAAAPASASPLIEALILKARRSAPASGVAPTPRPIGFAGAGANPFHALPTPLSNM